MTDLTRENFSFEVDEAETPVLIDFYATWCAPCRALMPIVEELDAEFGAQCKFCRVNIDTQEALAQQFDILSVPTLVLLQNGEIVQRISGLRSHEEIREILEL